MPKGVDQKQVNSHRAKYGYVNLSLMPKGVDHLMSALLVSDATIREFISDAERR